MGRPPSNLYDLLGEKLTISEIAELTGLGKNILAQRLKAGWSPGRLFEPKREMTITKKKGPTPKYTLEGIPTSIPELAAKAGISPGAMSNRLKSGTKPEEAIETPSQIKYNRLTLNGESLALRELARCAGLGVSGVRSRLEAGLTPEQIVASPTRVRDLGKVCMLDGMPITYKELGRKIGINQCTVSKRIKAGWTPEEIVKSPTKWVSRDKSLLLNGSPVTATYIASLVGCTAQTVRKMLESGVTPEEIVRQGPPQGGMPPNRYEVMGQAMTSKDVEEVFGVTRATFKSRLKNGMSPEAAALKPMRNTDITGHRFGRLVVQMRSDIDPHRKWKCLCDCGTTCDVPRSELKRGRVSCGCARIKFEPRPKKVKVGKPPILLDGRVVTALELAQVAHLSVATVRKHIYAGVAPEDILKLPRGRQRMLDLDGEQVTIDQLAARAGLKLSSVRRRLGTGESPSNILRRPRTRVEEDITGHVFGRLTVLRVFDKRPYRNTRWLCRCSCNNTCKVLATDLRMGRQQSCGCLKNELAKTRRLGCGVDLMGQTFGKLTVIEPIWREREGHTTRVWKCVCQCGSIHEAMTGSLTSGLVKSCGCLKHEGWAQKYRVEGKDLTIDEMAAIAKVSAQTVYRRLRQNMSPEECIRQPRQRPGPKKGRTFRRYTLHGERVTLQRLSELTGLSLCVLIPRLRTMSPEELVDSMGVK